MFPALAFSLLAAATTPALTVSQADQTVRTDDLVTLDGDAVILDGPHKVEVSELPPSVDVEEIVIVEETEDITTEVIEESEGDSPCMFDQLRRFSDMVEQMFTEISEVTFLQEPAYAHPCVPDLVRFDCEDTACLMAHASELSGPCAVMLVRQQAQQDDPSGVVIVEESTEEPCDHTEETTVSESVQTSEGSYTVTTTFMSGFAPDAEDSAQVMMMPRFMPSHPMHASRLHEPRHVHAGAPHLHVVPLLALLLLGCALGRACRKGRGAEPRVVVLEPLHATAPAGAVKEAKDYNML